VLWRLLQTWCARHPPDEIERAVQAVLKHPSLPPHLPTDALDALPHAPGVYLFYGLNEHPIYIGKSVDVRTRVASHFNAEHRTSRDLRLSQEIHRLDWEEAAGEFGALLRESELVKTRLPAHNVALRRRENQVVMELDDGERPVFSRALDFDLARLGASYGPFSSRAAARQFLLHLATEHTLCLKTMGLEGRRAAPDDGVPCFNRQLNRCNGACIGAEPRESHATRLREALAPWLMPAWPHGGAVALVERNAERFREDWHVFDRWCWLGTVKTLEAARAIAANGAGTFEADAARLAMRALSAEPPWPLERIELGSL
jgi:DNA polymerase-3 subunit epsilon